MKTVKNRSILLVIALALVLSLSVGLTFAYFSDYTQAKGGAVVALGGETKINENPYDDHKDIVIENTGDTDVAVRIAVYGPGEITYSESADWVRNGDYMYYTKVLPAGQKTSQITATWDVPADMDDDYSVVVTHDSGQVAIDDSGNAIVPGATPEWAVAPKLN